MSVIDLHPNSQIREQVQVMAACGAGVEVIAQEIGISPKVLQSSYSKDLELGADKANARVAKVFLDLATSGEHPALTLAWMRMRAGWKDAGQSSQSQADAPDISSAREKLAALLARKK